MIATTRLTRLIAANTLDEYGDPTGAATADPAATAVPCSLIERTRTILEPSTGIPRTVIYYKGRAVSGTFPVVVGDQVRDETTLRLYRVDAVRSTPRTLAGTTALSFELIDPSAE